MKKYLYRFLRRCITYRKELLAILAALLFAYFYQLMTLIVAFYGIYEEIPAEWFVPNIAMFRAITPLTAWLCFGIFNVRWIKQWLKITLLFSAFAIPFALISALAILLGKAYLWHTITFWIINIGICAFIALCLFFKPLSDFIKHIEIK